MLFQTSFGDDVFSITAKSRLTPQPPQSVVSLAAAEATGSSVLALVRDAIYHDATIAEMNGS